MGRYERLIVGMSIHYAHLLNVDESGSRTREHELSTVMRRVAWIGVTM